MLNFPKTGLFSCFLLECSDSMDAIYDTLKNCAILAAHAGGCGLSIQNIRAQGSFIQGSNGTSSGIVPLLQVYNNTTRYVDQGGKV